MINTNFYDSYISPTVIEERRMNVAQMDVFSRLMMERIIFLGAPIDADLANIITGQLLWLDSKDPGKTITMYINSPGGSVYDGFSIFDTMNTIKSPVNTVCTGLAASMASIILLNGKERYALPHSRILIHQPLGGVKGQASDIVITANEITRLKNELNQIIATKTGQPLDRVEKDTDRDYYMTAQEALKYGLIDGILDSRK